MILTGTSDRTTSHEQPIIQLQHVKLRYPGNNQNVLDNVNLAVAEGEIVAIVGKSGSGKTSILQMIGGLLSPTSGSIRVEDRPVEGIRENIGYVFQKPVLLEWRNVWDNIMLPAELRGLRNKRARPCHATDSKAEKNIDPGSDTIEQTAKELLQMVDLTGWEKHYPSQLSGGMLSRVSLIRSLLLRPSILLMDEPFAALDAITREQLQTDLLTLLHRYSVTAVFVTHDIGEAVFIADRVLLLGDSSEKPIQEFGVPLPRPRTTDMRFTSEFIECVKVVHQCLQKGGFPTK
jgi:NitT/TauT family transport system ATP-binding protein